MQNAGLGTVLAITHFSAEADLIPRGNPSFNTRGV